MTILNLILILFSKPKSPIPPNPTKENQTHKKENKFVASHLQCGDRGANQLFEFTARLHHPLPHSLVLPSKTFKPFASTNPHNKTSIINNYPLLPPQENPPFSTESDSPTRSSEPGQLTSTLLFLYHDLGSFSFPISFFTFITFVRFYLMV